MTVSCKKTSLVVLSILEGCFIFFFPFDVIYVLLASPFRMEIVIS